MMINVLNIMTQFHILLVKLVNRQRKLACPPNGSLSFLQMLIMAALVSLKQEDGGSKMEVIHAISMIKTASSNSTFIALVAIKNSTKRMVKDPSTINHSSRRPKQTYSKELQLPITLKRISRKQNTKGHSPSKHNASVLIYSKSDYE